MGSSLDGCHVSEIDRGFTLGRYVYTSASEEEVMVVDMVEPKVTMKVMFRELAYLRCGAIGCVPQVDWGRVEGR